MLSLLKKKRTPKGVTSVVFTEEGVAFACIKEHKGQPELSYCDFFPSRHPANEIDRFQEYVASKELEASQTVVVLPESAYQILLVERPDVPDAELVDALRWRIKDLINFDVEKACIDYFDIPEDAYRGRSQMVYVVVAMQEQVEKWVTWCSDIHLQPMVVDVPELALLNLTEELADSEAGLAVFHVGQQGSAINLLSDTSLYFTRQLSYKAGSDGGAASSAVLELQRSLDYYESQVGKPPCIRLMVMPLQPDDSPLMNELRENLPLDVHSLNLESLVSSSEPLPESLQVHTTVAVSAALRSVLSGGAVK